MSLDKTERSKLDLGLDITYVIVLHCKQSDSYDKITIIYEGNKNHSGKYNDFTGTNRLYIPTRSFGTH